MPLFLIPHRSERLHGVVNWTLGLAAFRDMRLRGCSISSAWQFVDGRLGIGCRGRSA